jgi:hypothetical protein
VSHVRIVLTGHGRGEVFVDGEQVRGVSRVQFKADAGNQLNELVLTINPQAVEIEGPADFVTAGVRLSQLLQQIADDPGTRLAPDLACSVLEFSTRVRK